MSIIISPSILGGSFSNMQETVKLIDQSKAEYIHFDVMDGDFVPNLTFGPQFISNVRRYSKKKREARCPGIGAVRLCAHNLIQ